jgi:quinol monooxygenase YgiN
MGTYYGKQVRFTAQQGQGDALTRGMLAGADLLLADAGCLLFVVSRAPDDPDVVWLTEVWLSKAAHDEMVLREAAAREQSWPFIADVQETELHVLGGKGLQHRH